MGVIQYVSGALLIAASIIIILVVLVQESKSGGLTSAIGRGSNDSFFDKNSSNTSEAKMNKITKICTVVFFIVTLVVNIIATKF